MAAPNIVSISTLYGRTVGYTVSASLASTGVANAASSNKVLKVCSVVATNTDSTARTVSLAIRKNSSTDFYVARNVSLAASGTVLLLNRRDSPLYLEENDSLVAIASATSVIQLVICYEEIG